MHTLSSLNHLPLPSRRQPASRNRNNRSRSSSSFERVLGSDSFRPLSSFFCRIAAEILTGQMGGIAVEVFTGQMGGRAIEVFTGHMGAWPIFCFVLDTSVAVFVILDSSGVVSSNLGRLRVVCRLLVDFCEVSVALLTSIAVLFWTSFRWRRSFFSCSNAAASCFLPCLWIYRPSEKYQQSNLYL